MKTYANGKSVKIEQAWVTFYDCEREANIEKYNIKLSWSYSMPKWWKSIMTSINEQVREKCKTYLDQYSFLLEDWEETMKINYDLLHSIVMKIFSEAIDWVHNKWESLFDIDIIMSKSDEKKLQQELNWIEKNIKELKYEIDAAKMVEKKFRELSKKHWVDVDTTPVREQRTASQTQQSEPVKPQKWPEIVRKEDVKPTWNVGKPVKKPKNTKPLKIWDFTFWK